VAASNVVLAALGHVMGTSNEIAARVETESVKIDDMKGSFVAPGGRLEHAEG